MEYAKLMLNKVIEENAVDALTRHQITLDDMPSDVDRATYRFVTDYAAQNGGQAPSYLTVAAEVSGYEYLPDVSDQYEYLARKIKDFTAQRLILRWFETGEFERKLNELGGESFINDYLLPAAESVKLRTSVREKVGTDIKADGSKFLDEYIERKEGRSFKLWKSKFPLINEQIGGYFSGNMYTWYGRSGRGKSVFTMEEIVEAAFQGATVLVWAMEMSRFEWMARAYSTISARVSGTTEKIDGIDYEVGFENRALLSGKLSEGYEEGLRVFVDKLAKGEILPGNIILRAADDSDFLTRDTKQLAADIKATKADVVLIDPIYLMDFDANTSRVAGGDVANTSKRIRRLCGSEKAVIHIVTQAEEVRDDTDDEGDRILCPPKRAEIKKSKAVLEDATNTFGIDSLNGEGIIEIGKGRNGGEGTQINVLYLPNFGIVREMETGEAVAADFDF
ncbi:AAA family ATPase [Sporosarcina sp. SAFN-015]|uniref:AAA family ATPase n=1 Tax=Sporosarcina sp. SAFN-015 TaxID=3387274 RepID=UPI003F7F82CC